jgi:hypothetical protein
MPWSPDSLKRFEEGGQVRGAWCVPPWTPVETTHPGLVDL